MDAPLCDQIERQDRARVRRSKENRVNDRIFDTITRDAAEAVSRRTSLLRIGGAALTAAMAVPTLAEAGKSRKNADKRCKTLKEQCLTAVAEYCASLELPQVCEAFLAPGCEPLARCNAREAIARILTIMTP